ncbi:endo alpha-1,4 polygalactosaminidase [Leucobacter sp. USHLN153]|uniref:endo alpha-1,4 polygalactosaminidase n=1 Tax=Leucobacter sp. USHLN153 TaxID=3081268 RepID=UPI00301A696A
MVSRAGAATRGSRAVVVCAVLGGAVAGCAGAGSASESSGEAAVADARSAASEVFEGGFPAGAIPDYQLGGAYEPEADVGVVVRDRTAEPAPGVYSICYVNAFQTQPGGLDAWPEQLLLQLDGATLFDPDWPDEALLDTSSTEKREAIAAVVVPWIDGCAEAGFDAVEFDNLDSYTRSHGALSLEDNVALSELLVDGAHAAGLAAGQKNAAEDTVTLGRGAGFDFAIAEECAAYEECESYTAVYGEAVIDIEYSDQLPKPFTEMCSDENTPASVVLRDRDLLTPSDEGYVRQSCSR